MLKPEEPEQQSNITIINSTFVGNQATALQSHQFCYAGGGALYSDGGISLTIQDSMFERNAAYCLGGVMATGLHGNHYQTQFKEVTLLP